MRCGYGGTTSEIASVMNLFTLVVMVPYISITIYPIDLSLFS